MEIDIISLFPDYFKGPFDESILKRAREAGLLTINHVDLRLFGEGRHRKVDDRVFGGGPGMLLKARPLKNAIQSVRKSSSHVIYLSPQGEPLTSKKARELAHKEHLILLCGHYEGIDQRIIDREVDEEISIGDYVLTNGALASIVLVDVVSRFIPGVLGNELSSLHDSFQTGLFDAPHYTQPVDFEGDCVPEVLLSGNHEAIEEWRRRQALEKTCQNRPDLYLTQIAKEVPVETETNPPQIQIHLIVSDLKKSIHFFKKILKCTLIHQDESSAFFAEGIWLAIGAKKNYPLLLTLKTKDQKSFYAIAASLMREGCVVHKVNSENDQQQLAFTDPEGMSWLLQGIVRKKENE